MIAPVRLYRAEGEARIAVVSVARSTAGAWVVRVARGRPRAPLSLGQVYGPYAEVDLEARFQEAVALLRKEGFDRSGLALTLADLKAPARKRRALAALRLGRIRAREAVPHLLAAAENATDEICSILDALGRIGDPAAIPLARKYAERKLLSRRRAGVEALRNLGDTEGIAAAEARALQSLDPAVRSALEKGSGACCAAVMALPEKQRGHEADILYEIAAPAAVAACRAVLAELPVDAPHVWRYGKSVLKRSMLRHDHATTGWLAHRIERRGRETAGHHAVSLKSGRDGALRPTEVFSRDTQDYVRRAVWRHLRYIARHDPRAYTAAAAQAVAPYTEDDAEKPRGRYGAFARCYVLGRILWGGSKRLELVSRRLKTRLLPDASAAPPAGEREEAFPELWDAFPRPLLTLLARSRLSDVLDFAVREVKERHPDLPERAEPQDLAGMIGSPHEPTVALALHELSRRFDPAAPDFDLLGHLLRDDRELVRGAGHVWLERSVDVWARDPERVMWLLAMPHAVTRDLVVRRLLAVLPTADAGVRKELAARVLAALSGPDGAGDASLALAALAVEALLPEMEATMTQGDALGLIESTSEAARSLGGALLSRLGRLADLGVARTVALAEHEVLSVRSAALDLLARDPGALASDPSVLFALAESPWPETRLRAFGMLRDFFEQGLLPADAIVSLCDSNRGDVEDFGREMARRRLDPAELADLLFKLAEHPRAPMRRFALELLEDCLPPGAEALARLEGLFRAVLFDSWPERRMKNAAIQALGRRGALEAAEAEIAVRVLDDFVMTKGRSDAESALQALARIRLAHPGVVSRVDVEAPA
ncbi:MAG: HEAT repeat domain-containing protein [Acidobacteriota bacterium]